MKRLLIFLLLLPSLAWGSDLGQEYARMSPIMLGGSVPAAKTCKVYESQTAGANPNSIGASTDYWFTGENYYPGANVSVCEVRFKLSLFGEGDIETPAYKYKAYIYENSSNNFGSLLGSSDEVAGSNAWSNTVVAFPFGTDVNLTANTSYIIVVGRSDGGSADATNYVSATYNASTNESPFDNENEWVARWRQAGTRNGAAQNYDAYISVYTKQ